MARRTARRRAPLVGRALTIAGLAIVAAGGYWIVRSSRQTPDHGARSAQVNRLEDALAQEQAGGGLRDPAVGSRWSPLDRAGPGRGDRRPWPDRRALGPELPVALRDEAGRRVPRAVGSRAVAERGTGGSP